MSLGTNRDYKTRDRAAKVNLKYHAILMNELVEQGMERNEASSVAFKKLMDTPFKDRQKAIAEVVK